MDRHEIIKKSSNNESKPISIPDSACKWTNSDQYLSDGFNFTTIEKSIIYPKKRMCDLAFTKDINSRHFDDGIKCGTRYPFTKPEIREIYKKMKFLFNHLKCEKNWIEKEFSDFYLSIFQKLKMESEPKVSRSINIENKVIYDEIDMEIHRDSAIKLVIEVKDKRNPKSCHAITQLRCHLLASLQKEHYQNSPTEQLVLYGATIISFKITFYRVKLSVEYLEHLKKHLPPETLKFKLEQISEELDFVDFNDRKEFFNFLYYIMNC